MAKNKGGKPPKSRPASTSALSQPLHAEAASAPITAFSDDASLFAHLAPAVDRTRLRVFAHGALLADYLLPEALTCAAMTWVPLGAADSANAAPKKRRGASRTERSGAVSAAVPHVALGVSDGTVLLYSPNTARVSRVLVASTPDSAHAAVSALAFCDSEQRLYGVTASGWVHGWDLERAEGERVPPAIHFLPDSKTPAALVQAAGRGRLLTAHHAITLYAMDGDEASPITRYSGHATPVTHLACVGDGFVSAAAEDRHVYFWPADDAVPRAMLTLDAPVRRLLPWEDVHGALVLIITERGTARVYRVPSEAPAKGLATMAAAADVQGAGDELVDAARTPDGDRLRLARIVKGVKVVLDDALLYVDGVLSSSITLGAPPKPTETAANAMAQRYRDPASAAGARAEVPAAAVAAAGLSETGMLPGDDATLDTMDADVDEPTLAQRLKALKVQRGELGDDDGDMAAFGSTAGAVPAPVGGASLASTLTQALHSGDHTLLTSCLVHSDPALIRATVRRLSGPLAVRLLEACVDRLNRGGVKSKGALGSGRARGIVEWIQQTLTCHTAYLLSLPNLVARLAALHHSLAARLASHERLLALKGRMELVMSQIDLHMAYTADEAPVQVQGQRMGRRSTAAEAERRGDAEEARVQGDTWVEPEDDVEDIGFASGDAEDDADDDVEDVEEDDLDADLDEDEEAVDEALSEVDDEGELDDDDSDVSVDDDEDMDEES